MNAEQAREFLKTATETEVGLQAIRRVGMEAIISNPEGGDDSSSIKAATTIRQQLLVDYPALFS